MHWCEVFAFQPLQISRPYHFIYLRMISLGMISFVLAWRGVLCLPFETHLRQLGPLDIPWASGSNSDLMDLPGAVTALAADAMPIDVESILSPPPLSEVIDILTSDVNVIVTQTTVVVASTMLSFPEATGSPPTPTSSTEVTSTQTIYEPPVTITVSDSPTTVTDTVTQTVTPTPSSWAAAAHFTNLDTFSITNFADGRDNLQIVDILPANATSSSPASSDNADDASADQHQQPGLLTSTDGTDSSSSTLLQLFYPANSTTPTHIPIGGADFYASPLSLSSATNVTLEYSVFFSASFDFVLGGKLPGLYGGHSGCSGGNNATTCFSTRMMWRTDGAGELYLVSSQRSSIRIRFD